MNVSAPAADESVLVSVIIPAHNEERSLPATLDALLAQTMPRERFEVLVLDDRSTDRTAAVALGFAPRLNLRVVPVASPSIAATRNRGAALATGEVVAFLDADCVAGPQFLERGYALRAARTLWGAHYLLPADATSIGRVWDRFQLTERAGAVRFLPGGTLLVERAAFEQIGGFQEALETSEDVELCGRARAEFGFAVMAYPELAVVHHGTQRTLGGFFRQNRWHGKHVARAFFQKPTANLFKLMLLSVYTLLATVLGLAGAVAAVLAGRPGLLLWAPVPLLLLPVGLALVKTARRRRLGDWPALSVLYLVYFLARAAALVQTPRRGRR